MTRRAVVQAAAPLAAVCLVLAYGQAAGTLSAEALPAGGQLAVFVGAAAGSVAGFGFSVIRAPMLTLAEPDAVRMVQVLAISSIAIYGYGVWALRLRPAWRQLLPLLLGSLAGLPVGVWLLTKSAAQGHASVVGAIVLAYALFTLFRPPLRLNAPAQAWMHVLVGLAGGITGGLIAAPALALAVWCGLQGWSKEEQRAVYQPFILIMQPATLLAIEIMWPARAGGFSLDPMMLAYVPPALLGAFFGVRLFRQLSEAGFSRIVNLLLLASGVALLT